MCVCVYVCVCVCEGYNLPPLVKPTIINNSETINNSEMIKSIILAYCSIQQRFIRAIRAKFVIPKSSQSSYIGKNSDWGISNSRISGQSLIKENCRNSKSSDDIDMKLGPVTNMTRETKQSDDVMSANCEAHNQKFFRAGEVLWS